MLSVKIWGLAQLLNVIICLICFGDIAVIIIPFAIVGGLPAILLFRVCRQMIVRKNRQAGVLLAATLMPLCTAACVITVAFMINDGIVSLIAFGLPAIAATLISTLLYSKQIVPLTYNRENDTEND